MIEPPRAQVIAPFVPGNAALAVAGIASAHRAPRTGTAHRRPGRGEKGRLMGGDSQAPVVTRQSVLRTIDAPSRGLSGVARRAGGGARRALSPASRHP